MLSSEDSYHFLQMLSSEDSYPVVWQTHCLCSCLIFCADSCTQLAIDINYQVAMNDTFTDFGKCYSVYTEDSCWVVMPTAVYSIIVNELLTMGRGVS